MKDLNILKEKRTVGPFIFSIIIPSWNNLPYLQLCIESIRKNSTYKHQLIVHVNEGNDGTLEWVKQQSDIDYTHSGENIGVCYALNTARSLLDTDYLLYMNDDMYVCPNWDHELYKEIKNIGYNFFFFSATAIEPIAQSSCSIESNFGTAIESFDEERLLKEYAQLSRTDWQGSTWPPNVVHKDVWDLVGGYSPEFSPGMYSDPDFSMKLWQLGVRLFKGVSKSRVYHFTSLSVKRVRKNKGYYTFISKWGITSSTLTKYYLRRGELFTGALQTPQLSFFIRLKNFVKRVVAAL
jgi:glycosyltransferase involved in cell wall biosynthesis